MQLIGQPARGPEPALLRGRRLEWRGEGARSRGAARGLAARRPPCRATRRGRHSAGEIEGRGEIAADGAPPRGDVRSRSDSGLPPPKRCSMNRMSEVWSNTSEQTQPALAPRRDHDHRHADAQAVRAAGVCRDCPGRSRRSRRRSTARSPPIAAASAGRGDRRSRRSRRR